MDRGLWWAPARAQEGMLSVRQLGEIGVPRAVVRHKLASGRWVRHTDRVVATTTGELTVLQRRWLGVLHAGGGSLLGGLSAAEQAGLHGWSRDAVTVLVDDESSFAPVDGVEFFRTRRPLAQLRASRAGSPPVCAVEPAVLLFGAYEANLRTAQGAVAAVVQQRLTTPDRLTVWLDRLRPLRRAGLLRRLVLDLADGAQSLAEVDVRRMCRTHDLPPPAGQQARLDRDGRRRWTDCEWRLPSGRTLVLEVDGAFHLEVGSWQDDLRRQRGLTTDTTVLVRCTAMELRDDPGSIAQDLVALGVGRASCASAVARATTGAHDSPATGP